MEIIVTLAVLALAGYWIYDTSQKKNKTDDEKLWPFSDKLPEGKIHVKTTDVSGSEYRVETTAPKCGCGRSPTGSCVGLHKLTPEEWAVHDQNPNRVTEVAAVTADNQTKAVAKAKKAPAKKPAAKRAPAKKKST